MPVLTIDKSRRRNSKRNNLVKLRVSTIVSNGYVNKIQFSQPFQFVEEPISEIRQTLNEYAPRSGGLLLVTIEGITPWLRDALCSSSLQAPPEGLLDFFSPNQRATYGKAVLPTFCGDDIEFAIENLDIPAKKHGLHAGQAIWTPLATWCCSRNFLKAYPDIPVIFIMSTQDISIHEELSQYYSEDKLRRFKRLRELPHWIFADLFSFTQWDRVWSATSTHINRLRDEVYGERTALPILEQTRTLHKFKEAIINQKECLRVHVAFTGAYKQGMSQMKDDRLSRDGFVLNCLIEKLGKIEAHLKNHQLSSERHLKSMEDLLSIAFNLETVAQGLQFKRLNYLAVIFLPLALVAAVFGMNNIRLQPAAYPRYAFPVLLATVVLGFISGKVGSWCEKRWTRGARALEARLLDEESSGSYSVPREKEYHQRRRSQNRSQHPPQASTSFISEKLGEAEVSKSKRESNTQYNIITGIPATNPQPPIRAASKRERGRHREPVTLIVSSSHGRARSASQIRARERIERSRDRILAGRQVRYCSIKDRGRLSPESGRYYGHGSF
ncbi:hypothetical protein BKA65DRAFT_520456 [Rhexocercosporidium sp. MPI-PUGE-AT-0058]|nr:hypothetical protein BKA65DRAFT_520456 [Rhexocercosporidium sp. MPI-PUGE-AT-0058]